MKLYIAEWGFKGNSELILDYLFRIRPLDKIFTERQRTDSVRIPDGYENNTVVDASEILGLNPMNNANEKLLILTSRVLFIRSPLPLGTIMVGYSDSLYGNCIVSNDRSFYWLNFKPSSTTLPEWLQKLLRRSPSKYQLWDVANTAEELGHLLGLREHHELGFFKDGVCLMRGYKESMEKIQTVKDLHFCEGCYKKLEAKKD